MDGLEGLLPFIYNSFFAPRRSQTTASPEGSIYSAFRNGRNGSLKLLLPQTNGEYCLSDFDSGRGLQLNSKQYGRAYDGARDAVKTYIFHGHENATCSVDDFYYPLDRSPNAAAAH